MLSRGGRAQRWVWLAAGLVAVAALACLGTVAAPVARLSASGPRVLAAVRDGYPELCHEWRDKLVVKPSPGSWYTSWDVSCAAGFRPATYALMTVNVVTCQWREPLRLSMDWRTLLNSLTAASQRLRRCP